MKQSKLRLLLGNIDKENIVSELAEIYVKRQKKDTFHKRNIE
ncbi:13709_t:CDS:1, partial [Gigaspora margarita]